MRVFNCPNILPVLGACVSLPDFILVSQYMNLGSLYSLLHERTDLNLEFGIQVKLAIDIAKGMEFLHNLDMPVYQSFSLSSKHIMIDEDFTAKINLADYEFSFNDKNKIYNPAWMSPECKYFL